MVRTNGSQPLNRGSIPRGGTKVGNMYLDYAEMQAARGRAMAMKDWVEKLNAFLKFSEYEILTNAGRISHEVAEALALKEYEKFRKAQNKLGPKAINMNKNFNK